MTEDYKIENYRDSKWYENRDIDTVVECWEKSGFLLNEYSDEKEKKFLSSNFEELSKLMTLISEFNKLNKKYKNLFDIIIPSVINSLRQSNTDLWDDINEETLENRTYKNKVWDEKTQEYIFKTDIIPLNYHNYSPFDLIQFFTKNVEELKKMVNKTYENTTLVDIDVIFVKYFTKLFALTMNKYEIEINDNEIKIK